MTAFLARTDAYQPPGKNVRVVIYAGVDRDHLQFSGIVVLRPDEVAEFVARVNGGLTMPQQMDIARITEEQ